jgi:uncharacterized protein (TIGR02246 family)
LQIYDHLEPRRPLGLRVGERTCASAAAPATSIITAMGGTHMRRIATFAVCAGFFAVPALAQTKAMIQQLDDQWAAAFNAANAAAVAAMYTADAYVLPAGAPMVKGREAIEAFWKDQIPNLQDVKCTALDVKPLGGSAAREVGSCSFMTKATPPQQATIKYAVVWQKEGGKWKLLQDIWNMDK